MSSRGNCKVTNYYFTLKFNAEAERRRGAGKSIGSLSVFSVPLLNFPLGYGQGKKGIHPINCLIFLKHRGTENTESEPNALRLCVSPPLR
jgi:hypothetical protein